MNKYHRYLNLPFEIRKPQICNVLPKDLKHYDIPNHKDINVSEFVKQWDLQIAHVELFYTPGGQKLPIHIDNWREDNHVKINVSWGPPEGTTRWWKAQNFNTNEKEHNSNYESIKEHSNTKDEDFSNKQHRSIVLEEEECELVYEANTDRPSLVNVGTFHSSYNPTDEGRWTLCFILSYDKEGFMVVSFDDAVNKFKDFIDGEEFLEKKELDI